jgi:MFS family permease
MKIKKNIILFFVISFIRSIILGMLQYFLRSHLKWDGVSLEIIAGYISLWVGIAYIIWGALSRSFKKKKLAIIVAIVTIIALCFFFFMKWIPFSVFMILTVIIWFSCGIWSVIKHIILSFEILNSGLRETVINGILWSITLIWALLWSYLGLKIFDIIWIYGYFVMMWLLVTSMVVTLFLDYDKSFHKKDFGKSIRLFSKEIKNILKKYYRLLLPIWILWSISIWFTQKIFYLGVNVFHILPERAVFLYAYSILWAIIWFAISAIFYKNKKSFVMISTIIITIILAFFLRFVEWFPSYMILEVISLILGIFFGVLINILEWRYFRHVWIDHEKEYWSSIYGIMMNVINFVMMIIANFLLIHFDIKASFIFFSVFLAITLFMYKRFDKEYLPIIHKED